MAPGPGAPQPCRREAGRRRGRRGGGWGAAARAEEAWLTCAPLTRCCAAGRLSGHGLAPVRSRGVGDSCSRGPQSPVAPLSLCSVPSDSDPRPPSHKGPCDSVQLTQALQDGVSISRSLSHWERPCCRMRSRVPGFAGLGRERRRGLRLGPPPPGCAVPFCARGPSVRVGGAHPLPSVACRRPAASLPLDEAPLPVVSRGSRAWRCGCERAPQPTGPQRPSGCSPRRRTALLPRAASWSEARASFSPKGTSVFTQMGVIQQCFLTQFIFK